MFQAGLVKILKVDCITNVPISIHISGTHNQGCNREVRAGYIWHWPSLYLGQAWTQSGTDGNYSPLPAQGRSSIGLRAPILLPKFAVSHQHIPDFPITG